MDKHPFSTRRGRKVRALKLYMNPLCERCESMGLVVQAAEVHHVRPIKDHPELAYALDNLESLCEPCHERSERGDVGGCGVDGLPIDPRHPWAKSGKVNG